MDDPVDFIVGAGAVGLGIAAQGIPGVGQFVGAALFSFGAGKLASGVGLGPDAQKGIMLETRSTDDPLPVVYGETKVGATLTELRADPATAGDDQFAGKVVAFAVGSENGAGIEDVLEVRLDEELAITDPVFSRDQTDTNQEEFFGNNLEYSLHRGSDDQLSPIWLENRFGSDVWDESGRGRGIAMLGLALTFDQEIFPGVPNAQLLVKGNRVYDPRDPTGGPDSDGFQYSRNPWLILLDYLTSVRYGLDAAYSERDGGDVSEIDEQSFIDAANHADELVPFTKDDGTVGSHARHTFDGWLPTAANPDDHKANITRIVQSTGGMLVHQSGKWRAVPKRPTAAVDYTLSEANIIGDWSGSRSGIRDAPSRIRAEFTDSSRSYQTNDVHWPETNAANPFREDDNDFPSTLALQLPGVTSRARAQRMAQVALKEARADKTFSLRADESALQLQVGDVVPLMHPTPGYTADNGFPDGKKFWVEAQQIYFEDEQLQVGLTLREYDPDAYVTELGSPPEDSPDPVLPDPRPGPIDADLIGAWSLGFGGCENRNCNPKNPCEPCLQCPGDDRRNQFDISGRGNTGTITKAVGFPWSDACPAPGPAGQSFEQTGGHHVNVPGTLSDSTLQLSNPEDGDGFTAMAWWYSTEINSLTASFGQRGDGQNEGWSASISNDGAEAQFEYNGANGGGGSPEGAVNIEDILGRTVGQNEWVHFAVAVHPVDENNDFVVDFFINGQWIANRTMAGGPIVPAATNATLGWGSERGDNPNITRIVGRMNMGLIYDGAIGPQDISKIHSGEINPTQGARFTNIDDVPDGQDFERIKQTWTSDGRPKDWLNNIEIQVITNDTCSGGSGLAVRMRPDYTSLSESDEGDYRLYVDWWEDGTHVSQENFTNMWDINGGVVNPTYNDGSTGSDAGDATEHTIRGHLTLVDISGTEDVAVDSQSASINATYGFSC